ncbi:MAG: patatin [Burkholderiales bacterium]|jgi:NTE family protein|nr:patatin [Burkholderiales bacterium]
MNAPHRGRLGPRAKGQIVLVLQGGGALGAYQVGVFQALHEAGIEPDWVIGTSIGAINAGIIAGNPPKRRIAALDKFWRRVAHKSALHASWHTLSLGIPAFFSPRWLGAAGLHALLGVDAASWYSTEPLRRTLSEVIDVSAFGKMRLTVGAVSVRHGTMRYFDSRHETLGIEHIMASGALPPAFPAIRIAGEPYWDGGIYSNTPLEAVLDDMPRRDSVIFAVNVWQPTGPEPETIWQVMGRQKDIQYASRADSHIMRQKQLHRLRHVIRELAKNLPPEWLKSEDVKELVSWGCGTTMHLVRLLAPRLDGEDHTKDIDFSPGGIDARRQAGYGATREMIERAPWEAPADPIEGVIVHQFLDRRGEALSTT